ncbi:MAG: carboxyvinyl-carboxyphosphonate phosphorylmutase [Planctomycetaceae bacterium]|nr:MAG: carboxyvinyl-carboxyphosphonate phosphorylmutase [Planctomycetaceae bacterium]
MAENTDPRAQLQQLLARPQIIRSLVPYDAFSARVLERAGLELLFLGGFGMAASRYALPDLGFLGWADVVDQARRVIQAVSIPVIVDADTGFGELPQVAHTVRQLEAVGAAGVLLEDQVFPKRCGHFAGKQVIPLDDMLRKLDVALRARRDERMVIIARTDARGVEGFEAALQRAQRFAAIGVDLCFVEAPHSVTELARIAAEVPKPQLANMLVGGVTPILSADELERLGFKICVSPVESLGITAAALQRLTHTLLTHGRVDLLQPEMLSFPQLKDLLEVDEHLHWHLTEPTPRDQG